MRALAGGAVVAALLLASCSSPSGRGPERRVGLVVAATQLNFAQEIVAGFRGGVGQVSGLPPVIAGPPIVDGARQAGMFSQLVGDDPGGISVFTLNPELFVDPVTRAESRGIPMIAVDNPPLPGSGIRLFVGNDNLLLGRMLADQVITALGSAAAGDIVLGTSSPGTPALDQRAQGMLARFREKLPGVRVLGPFDTKQETSANQTAWRTLVTTNPRALAFVGTGDADGWNLAAIRRETHATWLAGAYDLDVRSLQAVRSGDLMLVSPEHYAAGAVAGQLQARRAADGDALPEGWLETPGLIVNRRNVDAIIVRQSSPAARRAWFAATVDTVLRARPRPLAEASAR